eukprot:1356430-Amorphochlora_amoeboformis.AAC.1
MDLGIDRIGQRIGHAAGYRKWEYDKPPQRTSEGHRLRERRRDGETDRGRDKNRGRDNKIEGETRIEREKAYYTYA